ncbi:MAG: helix-turn-helix transcriptional regulator [Solirubrobacterales bacterium]|nr:helix-turn-helix transcriptional regulator [Solirubrobacterales bacterium]
MPPPTTPNQLVAYNLRRARTRRGWTQTEAAERLEPFLGARWSKATYSAAERSVAGERVRQFTAGDLYAFARCFELPPAFFLAPSPSVEQIAPADAAKTTSREEAFELLFGLDEDAQNILVGDVLELSAQTTRALIAWRAGWAQAAEKRQRSLDELFGARDTGIDN